MQKNDTIIQNLKSSFKWITVCNIVASILFFLAYSILDNILLLIAGIALLVAIIFYYFFIIYIQRKLIHSSKITNEK